jgi:hypothetical protein
MAKVYVYGPTSFKDKNHLWMFDDMKAAEIFCAANIENAPNGFKVLSLLGTFKKPEPPPLTFHPADGANSDDQS